jgi:putative membrane protein
MHHYYLWFKALHIIALISWMAGLLYLPRLFVYHTDVKVGSDSDKMLQTMERKLLRFIMNPAMILTYVFGIALVSIPGVVDMKDGWFHAKLLLVLILSGTHGFMAVCRKNFANGTNQHSHKFYRILNEAPTLLMIAIVLLVVLKPF